MSISTTSKKWLLILTALPVLAGVAFCCYQIYQTTQQRADILDDFSNVNAVERGLLSVNEWEDEVTNVIVGQIENFELTESQEEKIETEITEILYTVIDQAKTTVNQNDEGLKKTIRKWAVNAFVDWDELRKEAPRFSAAIVDEVTSEKSKDRLKAVALEQLNKFTSQIYDADSVVFTEMYAKYNVENRQEYNKTLSHKAKNLEREGYNFMYPVLGLLVLSLLGWFYFLKNENLQRVYFGICIALGLLVLLTGLATPMIEIDARIGLVDLTLMGEHIVFENQMLFYRSKSILQVVFLLLQATRFDSKIVGFLILAFSVILPISKLVSGQLHLFGGSKIRKNPVLKWLAFKSGKWSMADVMVVAIFMSYVAFDGILDDQLSAFDVNSDLLTSISTNGTNLQPGFHLFLAFVLFSLILSGILKKLEQREGGN